MNGPVSKFVVGFSDVSAPGAPIVDQSSWEQISNSTGTHTVTLPNQDVQGPLTGLKTCKHICVVGNDPLNGQTGDQIEATNQVTVESVTPDQAGTQLKLTETIPATAVQGDSLTIYVFCAD